MSALKYCYLSILSGNTKNAICTGSEKLSTMMQSKNFEEEAKKLENLGENPYVAFEKEFLRWMLSDGAGAALLRNQPNTSSISLRVDGIDIISFANELETCVYMGAEKDGNGQIIPWSEKEPSELVEKSYFTLKQDIQLLSENIAKYAAKSALVSFKKLTISPDDINYFLPHLSSMFFKDKLYNELEKVEISIPYEKWFTNLTTTGNVGAASGLIMLEELFHSGKLKKGEKILLGVPESARFSYTSALLTVV
jgi:3-oxoacyl-[acyl-carrier-protein] synthase-3